MAQREKKIQRMNNNPKGRRIEDCQSLANYHEIKWEHDGGSHCVFDFGEISLSIPANRPIKPIYTQQFVALIDKVIEGENRGTGD